MDIYGACCFEEIDGGGVCCDGEVDGCGVCQGDGGSCSLVVSINFQYGAEDVQAATGRRLLSTISVQEYLEGEVSRSLGVEKTVVQLAEGNSGGKVLLGTVVTINMFSTRTRGRLNIVQKSAAFKSQGTMRL